MDETRNEQLPEEEALLEEHVFGEEPFSEEESGVGDGEGEEGEALDEVTEEPDWQTRCLSAEGALADSLAFATLYAPYAKAGEALIDDPVYKRFTAFRGQGLSVNEAFAAASCDLDKRTPVTVLPSKKHLVSGVPRATVSPSRMSGEEMAIARELLGDGYSSEELQKLWNRVTKG